jgi:DNA-binding MarR family transcriptional regulator
VSKQPITAEGTSRAAREEAARAAADLGTATDEVDAAAAAVLGVNRTDLRILGLVAEAGTIAAGPLAAAARLSPAATTTAVQRLVAAGHLTRRVDDRDRRRAVLALTPAAADLLDRMYGPIGRAGLRVLADYTADELALITAFLDRGRTMLRSHAERIRALGDSGPGAAG